MPDIWKWQFGCTISHTCPVYINDFGSVHEICMGNAWVIYQMSGRHNLVIYTLRLRRNGHHFVDDILKPTSSHENCCILTDISLKFLPESSINNKSALVQMMAWHRREQASIWTNEGPIYWHIYASPSLNEFKVNPKIQSHGFIYPIIWHHNGTSKYSSNHSKHTLRK